MKDLVIALYDFFYKSYYYNSAIRFVKNNLIYINHCTVSGQLVVTYNEPIISEYDSYIYTREAFFRVCFNAGYEYHVHTIEQVIYMLEMLERYGKVTPPIHIISELELFND